MPFDGRTAAPLAARMRALVGPEAKNWQRDHYWDRGRGCLMGLILHAQGFEVTDSITWSKEAQANAATISGPLLFAAIARRALDRLNAAKTGNRDFNKWNSVVRFNDHFAERGDILPIIDALEEIELERAGAQVAA